MGARILENRVKLKEHFPTNTALAKYAKSWERPRRGSFLSSVVGGAETRKSRAEAEGISLWIFFLAKFGYSKIKQR